MCEKTSPNRELALEHIRDEYARRTDQFNSHSARQRKIFDLLMRRRHQEYRTLFGQCQLLPLASRTILDVGSGRNEWLAACRLEWGQTAAQLCGLDLLPERVAEGRLHYPFLQLECGSADELPWRENSFDLVHQGMLLSSILDANLRSRIVAEMRRVTKPGGCVLWYDFVWNPSNRAAVGIPLGTLRQYFDGWQLVRQKRTTLAPPLARLLVRLGEPLIDLVESLKIFNFWQLALFRKPN